MRVQGWGQGSLALNWQWARVSWRKLEERQLGFGARTEGQFRHDCLKVPKRLWKKGEGNKGFQVSRGHKWLLVHKMSTFCHTIHSVLWGELNGHLHRAEEKKIVQQFSWVGGSTFINKCLLFQRSARNASGSVVPCHVTTVTQHIQFDFMWLTELEI